MTEVSSYSYTTPVGGYGVTGNLWAKHLTRIGVDVYISGKFTPAVGSLEWTMLDEEERALFQKSFKKCRVGLSQSNPFDFNLNQSEKRVALTMCESDRVSETWPGILNSMDHIVVPNEFCERAFRNSGVTQDITVIPHGANPERFYYIERPEREIYTFGIVGFLDPATDRKGAFTLIQAFVSEFDIKEPVRLIIKSSDPAWGYYSHFTDPRISIITENINYTELLDLYKSFDCFVFPSKAEGIGLPPQEAMLTGLPVITTNWSGLEMVADERYCYPIQPDHLEPRPQFIEQNGNWAIVNVEEVMYWMRYCYEHRAESKAKGKAGSEWLKDYLSWPKAANKLKEIIESL